MFLVVFSPLQDFSVHDGDVDNKGEDGDAMFISVHILVDINM